MSETTTIEIKRETWIELNMRKEPGDSFDEVVQRLLRAEDETEKEIEETVDEPEPDVEADNVSGPPWIPEDVPKRFSDEELAETITAAVEYIRDQKKATMREIVRDVMPENSLGYDVPQVEEGKRIRIAWWRKIVRPGLAEHPDIKTPEPSESYYYWDG